MNCSPPGPSVHGDSPGKNTGVGCHVLSRGSSNPVIEPRSPALQADSLPSEPPGKPQILKWVACPFSRRSSRSRNPTRVSCIAGGFFTSWTTQEAQEFPIFGPNYINTDRDVSWWFLLQEPEVSFEQAQLRDARGDEPWDFFGRNDAEAEPPVLRPPHVKSWLIGKDSDAERDWGQEEKGATEDEMAGWHHRLDGRESEWTLGVGNGQGRLACCNSWGRKEMDTTERLNWTELY